MVKHTIDKYGQDHVAYISTFGTMATKGALKDVGRALDIDFYTMNEEVVDAVPDGAGSVEKALEESEELQAYKEEYPKLFEYAKQVEGKPRNLGTHASAVVATPEPITEYTPLARTTDSDGDVNYITQTEMHDSEELGLLKIDFLGLETLNVIEDTLDAINENYNTDELDCIVPSKDSIWEELPLNDEAVYENIFQEADNNGVFQVESYLFTDLLRKMQPESFEHIVALVALGRPGPIDAGLVDSYIDRMHGDEKVEYAHESLEKHLKETYGLPIFQESIMAMAREIAGFSLGKADILRRGMGKKKPEVIKQMREEFVEGALEQGHSEEFANDMFDDIEKYSGYAFNKSHSTAYALVSFATAYLKHYFPAEFYAALMSAESEKSSTNSQLGEYIADCYQRGIDVLPPDINESNMQFTAVDENTIRYGLESIKHVGGAALDNILEKRPFSSFRDFFSSVDTRKVNKTVVETLIKAGAFDSINENRNQLIDKYYYLREHGANQLSLFGDYDNDHIQTTDDDIIQMEMEALDSSVTHPCEFDLAQDKDELTISGVIDDMTEITDKNDNLMAFVDLETDVKTITVVVFTDLYTKNNDLFAIGEHMKIKGSKDGDSLLADDIELLEGSQLEKTS